MNKSQILYSILLIFLLGIAIVISNHEYNKAYSQRVLQTYENDKYGIKIQYPPSWDYREYKNLVFETGEAVVEFHPFEKIDPHIALSVSFLSPENATLESFTEQNLKSIQKPVLTDEVIKILNQNSSVTLGGLPAHKVVYESTFTDTIDKKSVIEKGMEMWTVLETEAYVLTFVGDREEYDQYIKTAEKIINSFQFTR